MKNLSDLSFTKSFAPNINSEVALNISMVDFLRQIAPLAEAVVKTNMIVNKVQLNTNSSGKPLVVTTSNNVSFAADHVIVTTSLGHLKANLDTLFYPPLSHQKQQAIQLAGFGTREKIVIGYNTPWWRTAWPEMQKGATVAILRDLQPNAEASLPKWTVSIAEFSEDSRLPNALRFEFAYQADLDVENLTDTQVQNDLTMLLQSISTNVTKVEVPTAIYR